MKMRTRFCSSFIFAISGLLSLLAAADLQASIAEIWRNGQLSVSHPTIQAAIDDSSPGDVIRIAPGIYYENLQIQNRNNPPETPITIEAKIRQEGTAAYSTVIIDGADPELQRASPDATIERWRKLSGPEQGWEATVPWSGRESRSLLTWASHANDRLIASHHNESFFLQGARGDALWRVGSRVRIRLADGRDPNTISLNIGQAEGIIQFTDSSGWIVRGLHLRHAGFAGVHFNGAGVSDILIEDVTVQTAFAGITTEERMADASSRLTVRRCRIYNFWDYSWNWKQGYLDSTASGTDEAAPMRGHGIRIRAMDAEVSHCEIAGTWDGMMIQGHNIRVFQNLIHHTRDDMVELESGNSVNVHFYDNVGFKLFVGISVVANRPGPIYIYRNRVQTTDLLNVEGDVWRYGYPLKFGYDWGPAAQGLHFYQNTFVSGGRNIFVVTRKAQFAKWKDISFYNNIFYRESAPGAPIAPVGIEGMGSWENGIRWAGNLFSSRNELERLKEIDPAFATAGFIGNPQFVDVHEEPANVNLLAQSPARARGVLLPDELRWPDSYPRPSDGTNPDIGAIPFGDSAHQAGPGGDLYWPWSKNETP